MLVQPAFIKIDNETRASLEARFDLEKKLETNYKLFYEKPRLIQQMGPSIASLAFTAVLFVMHLLAASIEPGFNTIDVIKDFSYFLAVLNGVGFYLLFSATSKMREFIANLIDYSKEDNNVLEQNFFSVYKKQFVGKTTKIFGFSFAIINCVVAVLLGISYLHQHHWILSFTFLLQVFTIGFIGGITVNGFVVVILLMKQFSFEKDIELKYFYPDQCAGTLIVGHILFLFSMHFIIIGILIFLFLHNFPWLYVHQANVWRKVVYLVWQVGPFLLSALIFFIPAIKINKILGNYKLYEHLRIRKRMSFVACQILNHPVDLENNLQLNNLYNHYEKLKAIDATINDMNTWPYNFRYRAIFLSIFLPALTGIILEISKHYVARFVH